MIINRRRIFQTLAIGGACSGLPASGQEPEPGVDALRSVATAHGVQLSNERLRVLRPVLDRRQPQLQALRDFAIDDNVAPTQGIILDK